MTIHVEEHPARQGSIGVITLDAPATLNALSETMIDRMLVTLEAWASDERICLVLLQGKGDRGFCAGGNIRDLYQAIRDGSNPQRPAHFFSQEYRLDYTLHRFPKPVIGFAHGVTMGGGLGLLTGCRYRLVTPDVTLAMPELAIGLFPDVGASWFLNRLPEGLGLFLGLTGARLNVSDALRVGLADMVVNADARAPLLAQLKETAWTGEVAADDNRLYRLLNRLENPMPDTLPASQLADHERTIARLCQAEDLPGIVHAIQQETIDSDWWQACQAQLQAGCPTSAWLFHEQLKRGRQLSLKDVFKMELTLAARCIERPDLAEGIRARLIDRSQPPRWSYPTIESVPAEDVDAHFRSPWPDAEHPLWDL